MVVVVLAVLLRLARPEDIARVAGHLKRQVVEDALGVVAYAGLLLSAALRSEAGLYLGLLISLVGTLFSAYLTYLEIFVIHALCQWCLASAAIMVGALFCASLAAWRLTESER